MKTGSDSAVDLHPLRTFLERRFGNVYDLLDWTPELTAAVTQYIYGLPDALYDALLYEILLKLPRGASREDQAAVITTTETPREIGIAAHCMAVKATPSLELVGATEDHDREPTGYHHSDIALWLEANSTSRQRYAMLRQFDPQLPTIDSDDGGMELNIEDWLDSQALAPTPQMLLEAWGRVTGSA